MKSVKPGAIYLERQMQEGRLSPTLPLVRRVFRAEPGTPPYDGEVAKWNPPEARGVEWADIAPLVEWVFRSIRYGILDKRIQNEEPLFPLPFEGMGATNSDAPPAEGYSKLFG